MLTAAALVVLGGAFAGGFVSGLAGFGTGLVALGIWLHVLAPAPAATLVVICSVVSQVQTIPAIWHAIDRARVGPMLAAGLVGVPVGTRLLVHLDPGVFRLAMGVLLLTFSGFMLLGRVRAQVAWGGRVADGAVGFAGGILGGLAGLSGPLPTMWATLRGWGKDERRGVFQAFNLAVLSAASSVARGLRHADGGAGPADARRPARHPHRGLAGCPRLPSPERQALSRGRARPPRGVRLDADLGRPLMRMDAGAASAARPFVRVGRFHLPPESEGILALTPSIGP